MGKALYRKYRPKNLSEVIGQEHLTTALGNALKKGAISHAYLFTGPRGTGKTSTARILAHEVNGLPYDEEQSHLDIIEIDAASNRRIDEIRELRERVHTAPTSAKYKVYIIDEVHMLTKEAFNALLKTLEEPPTHAIFILATTESHKLPETIISRTQRYSFKPVESKAVIDHLRSIAEKEKMDITDDALTLIVHHGGGSFRDSISLLDQTRNIGGTIDKTEVGRLLGIAPGEAIGTLWQAIESHDTNKIVQLLTDLRAQGYQSAQLAKQLAARLRQALIEGHPEPDKLMQALRQLLEVPVSHDADTALELALFGLTLEGAPAKASPPSPMSPPKAATPASAAVGPKETPKPIQEITEPKPAPASTPTETPKAMDAVVEPAAMTTNDIPLDEMVWEDLINALREKHKSLYSVMRMASHSHDGETITLKFNFTLHQRQANDPRNKQIILDILKEKTGKSFVLQPIIVPKEDPQTLSKGSNSTNTAPALTVVKDVFGGGEVLDS